MTNLFNTKTKIVATLGPSSADVPMIERMLDAGLHVARVNMSHGDHATHAAIIKNARTAAQRTKRPLAILQDLSGPKIRIGDFETEEVTLDDGSKLTLTTQQCVGTISRVHVNYPKLPQEVEVGMHVYLNDGKQKLVIDKIDGTEIHTTVINGGTIRGRRGVNIPDANLSISSLTAKDKKDLIFGLEQNVDFVTLSFVRNAADIHLLRKLIGKDRNVSIVAKIETKFAIENLDEIIEAADVIMVARGDLAIEMPLEKVPLLQKQIIYASNIAGKPVITATQMLDSMRIATTPTRAEVTDIANAIIDGTDAVMLSDETAVGNHPDRTIQIMAKVAREIENDPFFIERQEQWDFIPTTVYEAVSESIAQTAASTNAKAIVAFSESGYTAHMIARYRPRLPILVLTPNKDTFNQTLVVYGCEPVLIKRVKSLTEAQTIARKVLTERSIAKEKDTFVIGAGIPFGTSGATNMMLVERL
jgi:pyruvate kinase